MATKSAAPIARRLASVAALLLVATILRGQEQKGTIEQFHFAGQSLGGRELDQDSFRDHVLIVDLWGTWCGPCRRAVPVLVDLYAKYKQHGLEIVGLCYDARGGAEDAATVREFAAENRVTYELVPGTAEAREQVPDFGGYPTMLLFGRGLRHESTHVGYSDDLAKTLEAWVRGALGLEASADAAVAPEEDVPPGRFHEPGNGDRDVELEFEDVRGRNSSLAAMRGHPVVLALTTTWDQEAVRTGTFLQRLHAEMPEVRVIAWHLEQMADPAEKVAAVSGFLEAHGFDYTAFTTALKVARAKIHRFSALPTILVLDQAGVLVAREGGISDEIERRVRDRLQGMTDSR